jgi:hypothetical protein
MSNNAPTRPAEENQGIFRVFCSVLAAANVNKRQNSLFPTRRKKAVISVIRGCSTADDLRAGAIPCKLIPCCLTATRNLRDCLVACWCGGGLRTQERVLYYFIFVRFLL